ncbi:MAG: Clp protease N-terminal domain-containing protein, partial [Acidobacteriota bacterium]
MFDLGTMTDKFSESGQKVVHRALEESRKRDHNFLAVEHIFSALGEVESQLLMESIQAIGV